MKKYRIIVNLNRVKIPYKKDFRKAYKYHKKHGVDIEFIFREVDVQGYKSVEYVHPDGFKQYILAGVESVVKREADVDANMFVFDMGEWANISLGPNSRLGLILPMVVVH